MDIAELIKICASFGIAGLLILLIAYIFHYTIPGMQKRFDAGIRDAIEFQRAESKAFREMLSAQQTSFLASLAEERRLRSESDQRSAVAMNGVKEEIKNQTTILAAALAGKTVPK